MSQEGTRIQGQCRCNPLLSMSTLSCGSSHWWLKLGCTGNSLIHLVLCRVYIGKPPCGSRAVPAVSSVLWHVPSQALPAHFSPQKNPTSRSPTRKDLTTRSPRDTSPSNWLPRWMPSPGPLSPGECPQQCLSSLRIPG